ncbi:hypothetical protein [Mongoliibacter ruber]|uniref:Outer membrane protein with beta-barrel domain n=1 Tax=Mongoliibacter ruber TaxID=1750599 RepID=A0A2T0WI82_9BACT|nr:hypothetical protein [Mongoliibacter ruber]PRY86234.1 hypothetical protein CLW00_10980 [Mongoliibacter ruber]
MSLKKAISLFFTFIISYSLSAQNWGLGFQSNLGIPVAGLQESSAGTLFPELNTVIYYEFWNLPIDIGLSVGYGIYGTKLEKRTDLYSGFSDELRLRRNNNLLTLMAVFRYLPEVEWKAKPFIEVQGGTNYLYTRYKIRESRFEDPIEEERDFSNWIGAIRVGGGFKIPFKDPEGGFFEVKLVYQESRRVEFLLKDSTTFEPEPQGGGNFSYEPTRSMLTWIQPGIGVVLYMD